jgi:uncharacterized protein YcaQ
MSSATGVEVTQDEARRIAVRAQLLDGSATDVLDTVRRLGFLQLDPISAVAPPQHLVLWSRLGPIDRSELDRLLWEERKLFEWKAFIWPIEDLPLIQARMRQRWGHYKRERWAMEFLREQSSLRRYVLRELERRGPLLSRELEHRTRASERYVWWGTRAQLTWMLELLHRGRIVAAAREPAAVGSRRPLVSENEQCRPPKQAPRRETVPLLGVRLEKGRWLAHPDADTRPLVVASPSCHPSTA